MLLELLSLCRGFRKRVFFGAAKTGLRVASYTVTGRIRINLLLVFINDARCQHLETEPEIFRRQNLRRRFNCLGLCM
jgi:hypothetical protein